MRCPRPPEPAKVTEASGARPAVSLCIEELAHFRLRLVGIVGVRERVDPGGMAARSGRSSQERINDFCRRTAAGAQFNA
jgi:hypothetical protein